MDLINFASKLISWGFHSTCNSLAEVTRYFDATLSLQLGVHLHIEGASYLFYNYSLMDINLIVTLHLYFVLNMHLGNYNLCTCCIMVTGLPYAFWDLLVAHACNLLIHLHFRNASYTAEATLSTEVYHYTFVIDLYFICCTVKLVSFHW